MTTGFLRFLRGNTIALLALFVALGGTTYAATSLPKNSVGAKQLKKNAVTNPKIANGAVTGAKIANNSVKGADVLESSLGKVPSASNADNATHATSADTATSATSASSATNATTVGGASVDSLTIGRSTASTTGGGTSSSCDPNSLVFIDCGNVPLTLPRSGRVLIVADAAYDGANTMGYRGDCELTVDGTRIGASVANGTVSGAGALAGPGYNQNAQAATGMNAITDVLPAGAHTFALQCNQAGGTIEFPETYVSAVMIGTA
jgi:hypothetical protein